MNNRIEYGMLKSFSEACPFELAKHFKINISYLDFHDYIFGYYTRILNSMQIIINTRISLEEQEQVCDHLIAHHMLHPGTDFCLDADTFKELRGHTNFSQYVMLHKRFYALSSDNA